MRGKMKNLLKQCVGWLLSLVLGAVGGYAYSHQHSPHERGITTLRASRFELVDSNGNVVAFWGTDRGNNTVLAFLQGSTSEDGAEEIKPAGQQTRFTGQNRNEAFAFGMMSTQIPFMNILGKDGNSRASLYLTQQQKPILNMADERQESRLELGFISNDAPALEDDDWALRFRGPDVAGIGSMRDSSDHKYRGYLSVERNPKAR
jgi:hypothetical protein